MMKWLAFVLIVFGFGLHMITVDLRVLWSEELYGLAAAAGLRDREVVDQKTEGMVGHSKVAQDIVNLVRIDPEVPVKGTLQFLYHWDRHHFPAYYILLKVFGDFFGDATSTLRGLSTFFWILSALSILWLASELAFSPMATAFSLAFFVFSPTFFFYGQMIREYSFWALTILFCHAAFLKAVRKGNNRIPWFLYFLSLSIALYTNLFSGLIPVTHFLTLWFRRHWRIEHRFPKAYFIATLFAVVLYAPFATTILFHMSAIKEGNSWAYPPDWSLLSLFLSLLQAAGSAFGTFPNLPFLEVSIGIFCLFSFLFIGQKSWVQKDWRLWGVVLFSLVPLAAFIFHDLLKHSILSTQSRYLLIFLAPSTFLFGAMARYSRAVLSIVLIVSLISTIGIAFNIAPPLMKRTELAFAVDRVQKEKFDRIITFAAKSTHLWPGLARKVSPEMPWTVLAEKDQLREMKGQKLFVFLPAKMMLKEDGVGSALEKSFLVERQLGYWILTPQ